ncbi:MAG: hypothetical protein R3B99_16775 [Polyangiales bacterium]
MKKLAFLGILLAACGGDDERPPVGGTDSGVPMMTTDSGTTPTPMVDAGMMELPDAGRPPEGRTPVAPEAAVSRLVGTWAMESRFATIQSVPILGDQRSVSRAWGLVQIEQVGETLRMTESGCRVQIEGGSTETTISDDVPRSIDPQVAILEFVTEGDSITWVRPEVGTAVGFRPGGPTDALPDAASDARVFDQDGDGQPGVTVTVSGLASGEVYVVQWQRAWYQGQLTESGPLVGENHAEASTQKTIGASTSLLMMNVPSRPDTDRTDDVVRLIPLTGEYDCDRLVSEATTVFGG